MAEAAGAVEAAPLIHGLPDEISIWEIFVWLPPKDLLRCRAVCPAWRRATSIHDFLLAHHARQPTLTLLCGFNSVDADDGDSLDIIPFDHRAGLTDVDQLHSVARLDSRDAYMFTEASCDGLLVIFIARAGGNKGPCRCICNPATREYAPLPLHHGLNLAGMYQHPPTGEYRLLLFEARGVGFSYHVFTVGSGQPPRHVGHQDFFHSSFLFHGGLHWWLSQMIIVFDTIAELFWQMRSLPVVSKYGGAVFEIDGMLSVYKMNDALTSFDIWVLEDYQSEIWACKCRVELPVDQLRVQFGEPGRFRDLLVRSVDGDLLVLATIGEDMGLLRLLQIDADGKLVANFYRSGLYPSGFDIKQTLVRHAFFPALEGYVVNALPFI